MNTKQYIDLIIVKVKLNLRSEASRSYLSYAWWLLEPLMHMIVYYMIFGVFLNRGTDNFVAFLLCGLTPWLWYSKSISNGLGSIVQGKGLMNQVSLHKAFFPLVTIGQDFVKQFSVFLMLLCFLFLYGIEPSLSWLWLPVLVVVQLLFILPCVLFVAAIVPFIPDLRFVVNTLLMFLMFASGVFYSYEDVLLEEHRTIFLLNPIANLIVNYREVLVNGAAPDLLSLCVITAVSLVTTMLLFVAYKRLDKEFSRVIIE